MIHSYYLPEHVIYQLANIKTLELRYPELNVFIDVETLFKNSLKFIEKLTSLSSVPNLLIQLMDRNVTFNQKLSEAVRSRKLTHPERFAKVRVLK